MKPKSLLPRLTALILVLCLLVSPAAALTTEQARELLAEFYVDPVPQEVLDQPTIQDMLDALGDPYTEYLSAEEYQALLASMSGPVIGGIGVTSTATGQGLEVQEVLEGGAAQAAGMQAGDILIAVDGQSIVGLTAEEASALIRGEAGTQVQIAYLRAGRRLSATLTRGSITLPSTTGTLLEGSVGYIECETWGHDTVDCFRDAITSLDGEVGCWLVDLRGNTGGYTDAAVDAAGLFCGEGTQAALRFRGGDLLHPDGYRYEILQSQEDTITDKPVVVLVDGYSASSSEVFASILRDYSRAVIVGGRTFGKGLAQSLWDEEVLPDYFSEGDCLKLTTARFYSPIGNNNHIIGVIPHFPVDDPQEAAELSLALAQSFAQFPENWYDLTIELLEAQFSAAAFEDTADHAYEDAITALAAYGLVSGKDDGLYHPDDTLTRAELAQMLCNILHCPVPQTGPDYTDVAADAWYAPAVTALSTLRLTEGTGEGRYDPDRVLTRQELFTVAARLSRWLNDDLDALERDTAELTWYIQILDGYADWAKSSVWLLSCALEGPEGTTVNLLWDEPEYIDPTAPATRGEAAEVLYGILSYLSILP